MVSVSMLVILGLATFGVYRWGDASPWHLVVASVFGVFLGGTTFGPKIMSGTAQVVTGLSSFMGSLA